MSVIGKKYRPKRGIKIRAFPDKAFGSEPVATLTHRDVVLYRGRDGPCHKVTLGDESVAYIYDVVWQDMERVPE